MQALNGRSLKTRIPVLPNKLVPKTIPPEEISVADQQAKAQYKEQYDRRHGVKPLKPIEEGQSVLMKLDTDKRWSSSGSVIQKSHRTYLVETPSGTVRRNRKHLHPVPCQPPEPPRADPVPAAEPEHSSVNQDMQPPRTPRKPGTSPRAPDVTSPDPGPRRSSRVVKPPERLIETF